MAVVLNRKPLFILFLFVLLGAGIAALMFANVPVTQSEKVIELNASEIVK